MGNINSVKERLYRYIDRGEQKKIKLLLEKYPEIINEPMTSDCKTLPLARAAWRGDVEVCELLLDLGAKMDLQSKKGKTALIWAVIRNRFIVLTQLVARGADCSIQDDQNLDAMDHAILTGNYYIALYLKEKKKLMFREPSFYFNIQKQNYYEYVNFDIFIDALQNDLDIEKVQDFKKQPLNQLIIKDPVIDPRETWQEFFTRVKDFEDPPICERNELPENLQPQNNIRGIARSYINGISPYPKQIAKKNLYNDQVEIVQFTNNKIQPIQEKQDQQTVQYNQIDSDYQTNQNLIQQKQEQQFNDNL